uniref:Uncharacterized protein n=1 Tax=Oryza sativa subsp. japonica TaxID=39947 RepID=Q67UH4_ORYSJ|nr:hypothetical protein [Oryza sativa Japonica Group]
MAAVSSSGDADAGDWLKGSATSGVTGLRAAADEAAMAAATRDQAAASGSPPTTPAPSPRRPRRSRVAPPSARPRRRAVLAILELRHTAPPPGRAGGRHEGKRAQRKPAAARGGTWRRRQLPGRSWAATVGGGAVRGRRGRRSARPAGWSLARAAAAGGGAGRRRRRAGELEGVDGDVVAVVELDAAAGVALAEAVEAVEDGVVLADVEVLERPDLVLLGRRRGSGRGRGRALEVAHPPLHPVGAGRRQGVPPPPAEASMVAMAVVAAPEDGSAPAVANWAETARPATTTTPSRPTSQSMRRAAVAGVEVGLGQGEKTREFVVVVRNGGTRGTARHLQRVLGGCGCVGPPTSSSPTSPLHCLAADKVSLTALDSLPSPSPAVLIPIPVAATAHLAVAP